MTDHTTPPPPPAQPAQPVGDADAKTYLLIAHIGIILTGFLAPLIVWLIGKDRSAKIDAEGKEALNFGILISALYVIGTILWVILIGGLIQLAAFVLSLVFCIQAAIAVNRGEAYRYPLNVRLVK